MERQKFKYQDDTKLVTLFDKHALSKFPCKKYTNYLSNFISFCKFETSRRHLAGKNQMRFEGEIRVSETKFFDK